MSSLTLGSGGIGGKLEYITSLQTNSVIKSVDEWKELFGKYDIIQINIKQNYNTNITYANANFSTALLIEFMDNYSSYPSVETFYCNSFVYPSSGSYICEFRISSTDNKVQFVYTPYGSNVIVDIKFYGM